MSSFRYLFAATILGLSACKGDFLSGGELSKDPNRPTDASNSQLFVGVQSNIYYFENGDLVRIANLFSQHIGPLDVYGLVDQYVINESTTGGAQRALYGPGGLGDVRRLQAGARAVNDTLFLGIAQVQEAMIIGFAADAFGDVVYTEVLGSANPALDPQLEVYDSVQTLLSRAITNLAATSLTNVGPRTADLSYGGSAAKWTALAHTLKARFYMHTAEVRGTAAYTSALAESLLGISGAANDYKAIFSGRAGESNPWSVAGVKARTTFSRFLADTLLKTRADPRRTDYFAINGSGNATGISAARLAGTYSQPIATSQENLLIRAEAAYRTGDIPAAQTALIAARTAAGYSSTVAGYAGAPPTGATLLQEILTEKYIVNFQLGLEGWRDYRRTCFPNIANRSTNASLPMPGRFYYDASERQTNTNIPAPGTDPNGIRNNADPLNTTVDAVGGACIAGA